MPVVQVSGNEITYGDVGTGPTLVFVHGIFMNGGVWDDVVAQLQDRFRCLTPVLPLGGHTSPVRPGTDLGAMSVAATIPAFLDALDLHDVTLVANDTGGGLVLVALGSEEPGLRRIGRLVLTNSDSYENFPPKALRGMAAFAKHAQALAVVLLGRTARKNKTRLRYVGSVTHRTEIPPTVAAAFDRLGNIGVRRDAVRFIGGLHRSVTLDAAEAIENFRRPVLLAWGRDDDILPVAHARRLAQAFPCAVVIEIPGSKTYVMIDAPERLAQLITEFVATSHTTRSQESS
jgi:pimeloyl-ACP methyl ester carboxylesterase